MKIIRDEIHGGYNVVFLVCEHVLRRVIIIYTSDLEVMKNYSLEFLERAFQKFLKKCLSRYYMYNTTTSYCVTRHTIKMLPKSNFINTKIGYVHIGTFHK